MTTKIQHRRGTASQWSSANPVLAAGEMGVETDTNRIKAGNGSTAWNSLPYLTLADNEVTTAKIADNAVTADKIAANAVGASELADNAVDTAAIAASAVTSDKIADGTIVRGDVAASTFASFGTVGNLLTANQASVETDTTGFTAYSTTGLARVTSQAYAGSASLEITTPAGAPGVYVGSSGASAFPVPTGGTVTASVRMKAASTTTAYFYWVVNWYKADGSASATASTATPVGSRAAVGTSSFSLIQYTFDVPSDAAFGRPLLYCAAGTSASDVFYADCFGFWRGAGGGWAMPGTPIVGLSEQATNGASHLSGTGAPEGVITAPPGSTYLQTSGAATKTGMLSWRKETGTGNTGWVAEGALADTGRRNVASIINTDWSVSMTAGCLTLTRQGNRVTLAARIKRLTASGNRVAASSLLTSLPVGFRPSEQYVHHGAIPRRTTSDPQVLELGLIYIDDVNPPAVQFVTSATWAADDVIAGEVSWLTSDAWPAALPGVAA